MSQALNAPPSASMAEVVATVRQFCQPLESETVDLNDADGRVLRGPVVADTDLPPFDRSAVDGYAVGLADSSSEFQIVDSWRAGDWKPRQLKTGEAVQIATGCALPFGGLRVIMKEDVQRNGSRFTCAHRRPGSHIRARGEDAVQGQVLVTEGARLTPGSLAILASVGCSRPVVTRLPQALHVITGDEVVPPNQSPPAGHIRDSNSILVRSFLHRFGVQPHHLSTPEDRQAALQLLRETLLAVPSPDLLVISGGASVGEHDYTRWLLDHLGYAAQLHGTNTRPGKPMIFATRQNQAAFGLPGNPLAHFVCLNLFVAEALRQFSGDTIPAPWGKASLNHNFTEPPNPRETFWPAKVDRDGNLPRLTLLRWQSSGDLTALASVNALARIPPHSLSFAPGTNLDYLPV